MSAVPATPSSGQQNLALWGSTFAFTVCFAVWTIFSIIGIQIKKDLGPVSYTHLTLPTNREV